MSVYLTHQRQLDHLRRLDGRSPLGVLVSASARSGREGGRLGLLRKFRRPAHTVAPGDGAGDGAGTAKTGTKMTTARNVAKHWGITHKESLCLCAMVENRQCKARVMPSFSAPLA